MTGSKIICTVCGKEMFEKEKNEKDLLNIKTEKTGSDRVVSTSSTNLSITGEFFVDNAEPAKEIMIVTYICSNPECGSTKQVRK